MMIYCGYAIYNESETELLLLKKLLESCVFEYYIKNTSKPYSTGYYSFAKNYVKSFGVYPFNEEQRHVFRKRYSLLEQWGIFFIFGESFLHSRENRL